MRRGWRRCGGPGGGVAVVGGAGLGRAAAGVAQAGAALATRGITLRCLQNGLDTATAAGRVVAEVLSDLAALDAVHHTETAHRA